MKYPQFTGALAGVVLLAVLAGCSAQETTDSRAKKPTRVTATTASKQPQASLELLKIIQIALADTESPRQLAIASNASLVALLVRSNLSGTRVEVYDMATGKHIFEVPPHKYNSIAYIAWNPKRPVLALYSTVGETFEPEAPQRGFVFVDIRTRRVRTFLNLRLDERVPFDWMPSASEVATDHFVVNAVTGKCRRFELDSNPFTGIRRNLAISSQGHMAGEVAPSSNSLPNIYIFKPQSPKFVYLHKVGELTSKADYDTNDTTIRTRPRFLANGRLGYVWALLDPYNKPKAVEVRTSNEEGEDERSWVKLPKLEQGVQGNYSVAPVTWTPDGKILALVDNKRIRIFGVTESR